MTNQQSARKQQDPADFEVRLERLKLRVASEGRLRAVQEIDRAIEQVTVERKRA